MVFDLEKAQEICKKEIQSDFFVGGVTDRNGSYVKIRENDYKIIIERSEVFPDAVKRIEELENLLIEERADKLHNVMYGSGLYMADAWKSRAKLQLREEGFV